MRPRNKVSVSVLKSEWVRKKQEVWTQNQTRKKLCQAPKHAVSARAADASVQQNFDLQSSRTSSSSASTFATLSVYFFLVINKRSLSHLQYIKGLIRREWPTEAFLPLTKFPFLASICQSKIEVDISEAKLPDQSDEALFPEATGNYRMWQHERRNSSSWVTRRKKDSHEMQRRQPAHPR